MEDFIRRSTTCQAGTTFSHPTIKRADDFGATICAAQGIILNAVPGGPFSDLRLLNPRPLPFTVADAIRAMNVAMEFARNWAPALQVDRTIAGNIGITAFFMAWEVLNNGQPLGTDNYIPAQALRGTITSAASISSVPPLLAMPAMPAVNSLVCSRDAAQHVPRSQAVPPRPPAIKPRRSQQRRL